MHVTDFDVTDFDITIPVVKATRGKKTGNWWLHGAAIEEPVRKSGVPASGLKLLPKASGPVGEVLTAKVLSKAELIAKGILSDVSPGSHLENVLYVAGPIVRNGNSQRGQYYQDLLKSGARLGLRVQGQLVEETDTSLAGMAISRVTVTDQPPTPERYMRKSFESLRKSFMPIQCMSPLYKSGSDVLVIEEEDFTTMGAQTQEMSREEIATILNLGAACGLCKSLLVTQFEVSPASVDLKQVRRLKSQLEATGKLQKGFSITRDRMPTHEAAAVLSNACSLGIISLTKATEMTLYPENASQSLLKSLQAEVIAKQRG